MKCILLCTFLLFANAFNSKREFQLIFPGDTRSYAELDGTIDHQLTDFTLCHWSKTNHPRSGPGDIYNFESVFNYFLPSKPHSIWTRIQHNRYVYVFGDNKPEMVILKPPINYKWFHLCFIWSVTGNTYDIFINSQQSAKQEMDKKWSYIPFKGDAIPIQPNGIVLLGMNAKDTIGQIPLLGQVSEVNLWDYALTSSEVNKAYNCEDQFEGNVIAWSESRWKLYNGTIVSSVRLPCHRRD